MVQQDLFNDSHLNLPGSLNASEKNFLQKHCLSLRLDQIILMAIAFLVCSLLSFAFGFEQGKGFVSTSESKLESVVETKKANNSLPQVRPAKTEKIQIVHSMTQFPESSSLMDQPIALPEEIATPSALVQPSDAAVIHLDQKPGGDYTVQLATYKREFKAKELMERLNQKGYHSFMIPSGKFFQVCTNGFISKHKASLFLKDLKGQKIAPVDAYVRSIPR